MNSTSSPLLALPPELRNIIYSHALGNMLIRASRGWDPHNDTTVIADGKMHESHASRFFSLPFVCRQLHDETLPYLYSDNCFPFRDLAICWARWIEAHPKEQLGWGRSAMVEGPAMLFEMSHQGMVTYSETFPGLEKVLVNLIWDVTKRMQQLTKSEDVEVVSVRTCDGLIDENLDYWYGWSSEPR